MHLAKPLAVAPLPDEVTATGNSCVNDVDGLVAGATGYHDSRSTEIPPVAGLVVSATGYHQPTSWPPRSCGPHP